jgi:hypothetical protein
MGGAGRKSIRDSSEESFEGSTANEPEEDPFVPRRPTRSRRSATAEGARIVLNNRLEDVVKGIVKNPYAKEFLNRVKDSVAPDYKAIIEKPIAISDIRSVSLLQNRSKVVIIDRHFFFL